MKKFNFIKSLVMTVLVGLAVVSCKDDFNEEDAIRLQAELERERLALEDSLAKAKADQALADQLVRDSLLRLGGRIDYTVSVVAGGNSATTSARSTAEGATVTVKQNGVEFSGTTDASGTVYVGDLRIGNATLTVAAPDHTTGTFIVDLTPAEAEDGDITIDYSKVTRNAASMITLFPTTVAAGGAEITGRITGEVDLTNDAPEPIEGAKVTGIMEVNNDFISKYLTPDNSTINGSYAGKVIQASYSSASSTATTDANGDYTLVVPATASGLDITMEVSDIVGDQVLYNVMSDDPSVAATKRTIWSMDQNSDDLYQVPGALISIADPTGGLESGDGAAATAVLEDNDVISALRVSDAGKGYTQEPDVVISGDGFGATGSITLTDGRVTGATVTNGGQDYTTATVALEFNGEDASISPNFTYSYNDNQQNGFSLDDEASYIFDDRGEGYQSQPTVTISGDGTGATAEAVVALSVDEIDVTSIGSGYTETPLATFTGGTVLDEDNPDMAIAAVELGYGPLVSAGTGGAVSLYELGEGPFTIDKTSTPVLYVDDANGNNMDIPVNADIDATWAADGYLEEGVFLTINTPGTGYTDGNVTVEFTGAGAPANTPAVRVITDGDGVVAIEVLETTYGWDQDETITVTISGAGSGATAELPANVVMYPIESVTINTGGAHRFNTLTQDQTDELLDGVNVYGGGIIENDPRIYVDTDTDDDFLYDLDLVFNRSVEDIYVINGGEYQVAPTDLSIGGNATATFTIDGQLDDIIITNGGSGYTNENNSITVSGGGATTDAVIDLSDWEDNFNDFNDVFVDPTLVSFNVEDGGQGYTAAPNVRVETPGSAGFSYGIAAATVAGGSVTAVDLANDPVVYEISDLNDFNSGISITVNIFKEAGALEAEFTSGSVVAVNVTDGGQGYSSTNPPVVIFETGTGVGNAGDQGSGAEGTAVVEDGRVVAVVVNEGGSGYLTAPTVTFVEPDGSAVTAEAIAEVEGGVITGVFLRSAGAEKDGDYYSPGNDAGESGGGYIAVPAVTITPLVGGMGSGAVLQAEINADGKVVNIRVVDGGSGYFGGNTAYDVGGSNTPRNSTGGDNISVNSQVIEGFDNDDVISGKTHVYDYYLGTGSNGAN